MWPDLIAKSKEGGADVIQTYVFWNGHEPVRRQVRYLFMVRSGSHLGWLSWIMFISFYLHIPFIYQLCVQYNFEGRYDVVKFVKLVGSSGLYLHLRIGPYVCAEWNFGSHLLSNTDFSISFSTYDPITGR